MTGADLNDGLRPPVIETLVDDDGRCRTTVYRYDQVLTEERKALIRSVLPDAQFTTRMRISPSGKDGSVEHFGRVLFSEVLDSSMAEIELGQGAMR